MIFARHMRSAHRIEFWNGGYMNERCGPDPWEFDAPDLDDTELTQDEYDRMMLDHAMDLQTTILKMEGKD